MIRHDSANDATALSRTDPRSIVHSLVDDTLDRLDEQGASLGAADSDQLFEARADAIDDLLHTDRDPFGEDLVAIAHTLQVLSAEYGLRDIQEPAQFPDCAATLVETFRADILWHHLEAAVAAELSGEAHGRGMHSARTDAHWHLREAIDALQDAGEDDTVSAVEELLAQVPA